MKKTQIALALMVLISAHAAATPIVGEDFNQYLTSNYGVQADTGLKLGAWGDLPNWSKSGIHSIHAVERSTGNWAVMLYDTNAITMNAGAAANTAGATYQVSFDAAAAVYAAGYQSTNAGGQIHFDVINSVNTTVASFDYAPGAWTGSSENPFHAASFNYVGDGSGDVRLRIVDSQNDGRFAGAIDNLQVNSVNVSNNVPEPASFALLLGGLSAIGIARRKSKQR